MKRREQEKLRQNGLNDRGKFKSKSRKAFSCFSHI